MTPLIQRGLLQLSLRQAAYAVMVDEDFICFEFI